MDLLSQYVKQGLQINLKDYLKEQLFVNLKHVLDESYINLLKTVSKIEIVQTSDILEHVFAFRNRCWVISGQKYILEQEEK